VDGWRKKERVRIRLQAFQKSPATLTLGIFPWFFQQLATLWRSPIGQFLHVKTATFFLKISAFPAFVGRKTPTLEQGLAIQEFLNTRPQTQKMEVDLGDGKTVNRCS
jgi:hypothetical protein